MGKSRPRPLSSYNCFIIGFAHPSHALPRSAFFYGEALLVAFRLTAMALHRHHFPQGLKILDFSNPLEE
jgi:hypothetical protein